MKRRNFLQQSGLAASAVIISPFASRTAEKKKTPGNAFNCKYAFEEGHFENQAGKNFLDQIKFGYDLGFRAIEDNGMLNRKPEEQKAIGDLLARLGMQMGVFVIAFDKWPNSTTLTSGKKEWQEKFLSFCKTSVEAAKRCNAKWMTVVPGNFNHSLPVGYQTSNVVSTLRKAAVIFEPHGLVMALEPLSDTPDLFLRFSSQAYEICKAVNSPSCKILYDMYHIQRNEGNIIENMDAAWDEIAYIQIGDNPGRNEPSTGEMNYKNIFKHIYEKGYRGLLGMEHGVSKQGKEGEQRLIQSYREADAFL